MLEILDIYIILPFVFALLFAASKSIKEHSHIRKTLKAFFMFEFVFSFFILITTKSHNFTFLNIGFCIDRISAVMLFLTSFIFLLFAIISKSLITRLRRLFVIIFSLLFGLVNLILLHDNIFICLLSIFWIFLIYYFLSVCFIKNKKSSTKLSLDCLIADILFLFCALFLMGWNFIRYFVLNDIEFNFSNIAQSLDNISDFSTMLAFCGFLIIIFRFFNLIPFVSHTKNAQNVIPIITSLKTLTSLIVGGFLFTRYYALFDYLLYQNQKIIAAYLLLNFIYFVILSQRQDSLSKFLLNSLPVFIINGLFCVFSFDKSAQITLLYYLFTLVISYCFVFFVFTILQDKFKTDKIDELKKISDKTRLNRIFIAIPLLNLASAPFFAMFSANIACFITVFATSYNGIILNYMPYCLILGMFILCLSTYNIIYKVLIEPIEKSKNDIIFANHQILIFTILTFVIVILSIYPQQIFSQLDNLVINRFW